MTLLPVSALLVIVGISTACSDNKSSKATIPVDTSAKKLPIAFDFKIPVSADSCFCDTNAVLKRVRDKKYNFLAVYDEKSFTKEAFFGLDSSKNRMLWFRDVESPFPTKFTALWDAYSDKNYYANSSDFTNYYETRQDIPLAFIFGPNYDLWAYHIFVVRKIEGCLLLTRSYYRHNRFVYKSYAVARPESLREIYFKLLRMKLKPVAADTTYAYKGYFVDNRKGQKFLVNFEEEVVAPKDSASGSAPRPKFEVLDFYNCIDKGFRWQQTY